MYNMYNERITQSLASCPVFFYEVLQGYNVGN